MKRKSHKINDENIQREIKQDLTNALERYRALVKNRRRRETLNSKQPEIYHLYICGK